MLFLLSPLKLIVLFMFYFLPSPSGKVSLKATEGDNKSLLRFTFRFISPIVKISLNLDFATLPTERAPFVALRHFPRFIGEIYPEGGSETHFWRRVFDFIAEQVKNNVENRQRLFFRQRARSVGGEI